MESNGSYSWERRAYWGANNIAWGTDGTVSRYHVGSLPAAGQWVRLEVPATTLGLEGKIIEGMAFTLYGGRAAWDRAGKLAPDMDGDGLPDAWELLYFGGLTHTATEDYDGDGLSNLQEYQLNTSPVLADTGGTGTSDAYKDSDGDGLTNLEEFKLGKNPLVPDVASPIFSPVGGSYASAQNITVTCPTASAAIHYTLNGNEPTQSDPTVASGSTVPVNGNPITLKAKAWKTGWTASDTENESYRIETQPPSNVAPTVTISPASGGSFLASDSIEILVEAADADGTIAKVQLFRGNYKVAETTSSPLRHSLDNVPAGTYTFTAKAIDNNGAVSVSSSIIITISASDPVVSLVGTQPFFTSSPGTLAANIIGVNPGTLTSLTLNGAPLVPRAGEFLLNVSLTEGENTFTLVATDNQSRTAQATTKVYLDSVAPVIAITAPANNSSFTTDRINVSGTFTESTLKQITVNGVLAFINGNTFSALNVPLAAGANTITATAEDIAGNQTTVNITVTGSAAPVNPVQLSANLVGGFAPLNVTFTVVNNAPGALQYVYYDFNGDNVTDQTEVSLNPVTHPYTAAGEYFPVVTIQTTAGKFSSLGGWNSTVTDRLRINVQAAPVTLNTIPITDPVDLKATANGHLYVLSRSTATITEYDASLVVVRSKSSIGTTPTGLDVDSGGNVYVALSGENHVAKLNPTTGTFQLDTSFDGDGLIGSSGSGNGQFNTPFDVAVSPDGAEIAVSDSGNHRVQRFAATDGIFLGSFGEQGSGSGQFNTPKGLTYDSRDTLFVVDSANNRVVMIESSLVVGTSGVFGTGLGQFQGARNISVSSRGVYVADTDNSRIQVFDPIAAAASGMTAFKPRLALSTLLDHPNSVAGVSDLMDEKIYIADTANNRVLLVKLPSDTPEAAWSAMKQHLTSGDINGAIPYFSSATAENFRKGLLALGAADVASLMNITTISPVFVEGDTAQYYFEQVIDGVTMGFPINFVLENGTWRIEDF